MDKDTNPDCPDTERYQIVIKGSPRGLYLMVSADGYHFRLKSDKPFATDGAFESQNLMFWDSVGEVYREYHRKFDKGVRGIVTAASKAGGFFPEPEWLKYPGSAEQALYTNQVQPYYRAPHILMGCPMRYNDRGWSTSMTALPGLVERQFRSKQSGRYGTTVTDAAFMTSRDGVTFHRWGEAFIRPGPATRATWVYGDNFIFWGMIQTKSHLAGAADDIALYATEGYWEGESTSFRRYTLRQDGFVSATAGWKGGRLQTKSVIFQGHNWNSTLLHHLPVRFVWRFKTLTADRWTASHWRTVRKSLEIRSTGQLCGRTAAKTCRHLLENQCVYCLSS